MKKSVFTSESVTRGHPDKVCDQIADRILDELLRQDPESHVACEVTCATDQVHIFGEITSDARVDYEEIARKVIAEIGYTEKGHGFDAESCAVRVDLHEQSPDIARGVCKKGGKELLDHGAGDQGMMFGRHDVRLCLPSDRNADALPDRNGARAGQAAGVGAQDKGAAVSVARW